MVETKKYVPDQFDLLGDEGAVAGIDPALYAKWAWWQEQAPEGLEDPMDRMEADMALEDLGIHPSAIGRSRDPNEDGNFTRGRTIMPIAVTDEDEWEAKSIAMHEKQRLAFLDWKDGETVFDEFDTPNAVRDPDPYLPENRDRPLDPSEAPVFHKHDPQSTEYLGRKKRVIPLFHEEHPDSTEKTTRGD